MGLSGNPADDLTSCLACLAFETWHYNSRLLYWTLDFDFGLKPQNPCWNTSCALGHASSLMNRTGLLLVKVTETIFI